MSIPLAQIKKPTMKKGLFQFLTAVTIVSVFALGLSSCNSEGEEESTDETEETTEGTSETEGTSSSTSAPAELIGEWQGTNIAISSPDMTEEEAEMMNAMMGEMAAMITMTFDANGVATMTDPQTGAVQTGTYAMNGDNTVMTMTDDATGEATDFNIAQLDSENLVLDITDESFGTVTISLAPAGMASAE